MDIGGIKVFYPAPQWAIDRINELEREVAELKLEKQLVQQPTSTKWELLFKHPGCHSWFRDEHGRIAPADDSGRTPSETDDGVHFLEQGQHVACSDENHPIIWLRSARTGQRTQLGGTNWIEAGVLRQHRLISFA